MCVEDESVRDPDMAWGVRCQGAGGNCRHCPGTRSNLLAWIRELPSRRSDKNTTTTPFDDDTYPDSSNTDKMPSEQNHRRELPYPSKIAHAKWSASQNETAGHIANLHNTY